MRTRFSIKSILAISSIFVLSAMSTTAGAWVSSTSTTQTSCTLLQHSAGLCSMEVDGILNGLGNVTNNPTAFTANILIREGTIVGLNPAGNTSTAQGVPFGGIAVNLTASGLIDAAQVSKNGRTLESLFFHDPELIAAIEAALQAGCDAGIQSDCDALDQIQKQVTQHPNWIQTVVVTKVQVLGEQYEDGVPSTCNLSNAIGSGDFSGCTATDALGSNCTAPNNVLANPKNFAWKSFTYQCTVVCHDKTGSGYPECPASVTELPWP